MEMGGKLTLSDDSHGIDQVGTNYGRTVEYLESLGVEEVWGLEVQEVERSGKMKVSVRSVGVEDIKRSLRYTGR